MCSILFTSKNIDDRLKSKIEIKSWKHDLFDLFHRIFILIDSTQSFDKDFLLIFCHFHLTNFNSRINSTCRWNNKVLISSLTKILITKNERENIDFVQSWVQHVEHIYAVHLESLSDKLHVFFMIEIERTEAKAKLRSVIDR